MQNWQHFLSMAQQGDLNAFDGLVRHFRDMAVGYAYSILGDFQLAEDAAQEAFVQAYRDLNTLRIPAAFPSWLRKIVYKYCDRITRKKVFSTIPIEIITEPPDNRHTPPEAMQQNEIHDTTLHTINSLPEQERTVTALFYINGYSMSEVGGFLDVPVTTVKSRLHSARKKLRERMVTMIEETLKRHAPEEAFNRRVRRILENVPVVGFELHRNQKKDGLNRCPESMPFPSCLRACMEYLGDDLGYRKITEYGMEWRLDNTYVYLMGTTGMAFKLTWKPGWHMDNPSIYYLSEEPFTPIKEGLESVGYGFEILPKETGGEGESYFRRRIIESINTHGRPVIANGVVGPPVDCLVTGFDEEGEVLLGWSFFQGAKEFNDDVEFEENGYFRKRNWFNATHHIIVLGEKKPKPDLESVYRHALEGALKIIRTPEVRGRHNGLGAYNAWSDAVLRDEEFTGKNIDELHYRYLVHQDAVGPVAEGRWYAFNFLKKIIHDINVPETLEKAALCFNEEHSLMWKVWELVGGPGMSPQQAELFAGPDIRKKTARLILQARDRDMEAAAHIEETLKNW